MDTNAPRLGVGDPAMPSRAFGNAALVPTGRTCGRPLGGGGLAAADAKPLGDPGEGPLIVPVQLGGQTGFAGQAPARGGMAAAIHTQSDGASSIPAASGGLLVPFGGKRLAIRTAPAAGRRRGLAALDAERAVGLPAAAVDPGAVCPPARGEAVVAARIAFGRRPVPALYAEAGLLPFFLALLQAPAAEREMFFVAGLA